MCLHMCDRGKPNVLQEYGIKGSILVIELAFNESFLPVLNHPMSFT